MKYQKLVRVERHVKGMDVITGSTDKKSQKQMSKRHKVLLQGLHMSLGLAKKGCPAARVRAPQDQ